jgi:hypothetical protein
MIESTPTDELKRAFRQAYQEIIDQTELPGDALPTAPLSKRPHRRVRGPLVALAAAALVLAIGGLAFLTGDPDDLAGPIERLALVEPPAALGGAPVVQYAQDGEQAGPPVTEASMWVWAGDDRSSSVALFESELDADMTNLLGTTEDDEPLSAPGPNTAVEMILPNFGWYATSWTSGGKWRIAVGFDDAEVREMVEVIEGEEPSSVELEGRHLVYEGPQIVVPEGATSTGIYYDSPAGEFGVWLLEGQPDILTSLAPLLFPRLSDISVNGRPAMSGSVGEHAWEGDSLPDRAILWEVGEEATAFVAGVDLSPDVLHQVAEGVRPVTLEEWQAIADTGLESVD